VTLLFKVEDRFSIAKNLPARSTFPRGCVLFPGIPYDFEPTVKVGAALELRFPDGKFHRTAIEGFPHVARKVRNGVPILLPSGLMPEDIPLGTAVYLLPDDSSSLVW
jgi:hypothetical protein